AWSSGGRERKFAGSFASTAGNRASIVSRRHSCGIGSGISGLGCGVVQPDKLRASHGMSRAFRRRNGERRIGDLLAECGNGLAKGGVGAFERDGLLGLGIKLGVQLTDCA